MRIIQNLSTIYIMNSLGRIAGQFFFVVVILFSCQEDTSLLGFKRAQNNFRVAYAEIPLPASVMLIDSLRTFNESAAVADTKRLLVGQYTDDKFGLLTSAAFTQFRPYASRINIPADAVVNEVYLNLTYDYYYFGSNNITNNTFFVHELTDTLFFNKLYNFNSVVGYDPVPLGSVTSLIDVEKFDAYFKDNNDASTTNNHIDTLKIGLSSDFGERILSLARTSTSEDSDYATFQKFSGVFKGLAILNSAGNKVIGFDPRNDVKKTFSKMVIIYRYTVDGVEKRGRLDYALFSTDTGGVMGFNKIDADRSSTVLSGQVPFQEFIPSDNQCYIQAGNPIVTKLDFSKFYQYIDTIPTIIFNSAELLIDPIVTPTFPAPSTLRLRVLKDDNRFRRNLESIPSVYSQYVLYDIEGNVNPLGDIQETFFMQLASLSGVYSYRGFLTVFTQALSQNRTEEDRFEKFAIVPSSPDFGKSLNRLNFDINSVRLKIYYTVPNINQ